MKGCVLGFITYKLNKEDLPLIETPLTIYPYNELGTIYRFSFVPIIENNKCTGDIRLRSSFFSTPIFLKEGNKLTITIDLNT